MFNLSLGRSHTFEGADTSDMFKRGGSQPIPPTGVYLQDSKGVYLQDVKGNPLMSTRENIILLRKMATFSEKDFNEGDE